MKVKLVKRYSGKTRIYFLIFFSLTCLQSCIYIGVKRNINLEHDKKIACSGGSKSENAKCNENAKILKDAIEKHSSL